MVHVFIRIVAGGRRLAAVKELGWDEVPITIVDWFTAEKALRAESDENTCRKPLTPYEASKARQRRAKVLSEDAKTRQGARTDLAPSSNLEPSKPQVESKTRHAAATGTGYSATTLDKVDKVVQIAEKGSVTVGRGAERYEMPVPPEVQEVAQKVVEGLKQTGAAVDAADKAVSHALETFVESDPDLSGFMTA